MKKIFYHTAIIFVLFFYQGYVYSQLDTTMLKHRNAITLSITGFVFNQYTLHYEYHLSDNLLINIPFSYGYREPSCGDYFTSLWFTGININYIMSPKRKISYVAGVGFRYGKALLKAEKCDPDGITTAIDHPHVDYYKLFLNNGFTFTLWKKNPVTAILSLGPRFFNNPSPQTEYSKTTGYFTINVGYCF